MRNFHLYEDILINTIFSWSIEDILSEELYVNEVRAIPDSFESANEYFSSFVHPLLEETRAQLCSSLEFIGRSPFSEVISIKECKSKSTPQEATESTGFKLYDVQVNGWKNRFTGAGKESYKTLPGDIFVFTNEKPETTADLRRTSWSWTFVIVTKSTENDDGDGGEFSRFKVKAMKDLEIFRTTQKSLFLVFLSNITTNKRIWNGINLVGNLPMIEKVLRPNSTENERIFSDFFSDENLNSNLESQLNESQLNAIRSCLGEIKKGDKSGIQLIWGPPGTGKTKTVSTLLVLLSQMKLRTLVCAPTNVAIVELASKVLKLVRELENKNKTRFCPLGDILLFGSHERLNVVGSYVQDVYLNHRVPKIADCCGLFSGWRNCIGSMMSFFEDSVSQYDVLVENQKILEREERDESEDGCKSFLEYSRQQFNHLSSSLRDCLSSLCTHLPKDFVSKMIVDQIETLFPLLDSFELLLFEDDMDSEALKERFSCPLSSIFVAGELITKRSHCFSGLKALESSLSALKLPNCMNDKEIKAFCFKKASMIFCTASSSYQLHTMKLEPFDILIIDEAAQLKECESCIPLQVPWIRHAVFIGDEFQLQAMVQSRISQEVRFSRSLFERLSSIGHPKHLLNKQYRMHPAITFFPNLKFYKNMILDGPNVSKKCYGKRYLDASMFGPYSFINVAGGREETDDGGRSKRNMVEVAIVLKIVRNLYKEWNGEKLSIGIISPYTAQVVAIEEKLGCKYEDIVGFSVNVKSIDGFQGGEEDVIIISTVRSNSRSSIGFVSNAQRTNVALTRARHCLWILGSERTLGSSGTVWEELVIDAKKRHCFFDADQNKDLAKVILEVKKEIDYLDDLLHGNSTLFRDSKWKVVFSDRFLKSFKKLLSKPTKISVLMLLVKLLSGWRPKRSSSQIVEQYKVGNVYVLCTIDIVKDASIYTQVLKIWDVLPLENISKFVKQLESIHGSYSDHYLNCCAERCFEGKLEVPRTWTASKEIVRFKISNDDECERNDSRSYVENSKVSDSLLLMKFYSLSFGVVNHLLSDRDDVELDLPFEVTDEELEIILYPRSTFVLGRSGTGKTTVLTMKLFQKEKLHLMAKVVHGVEELESSNEDVIESSSGPRDSILRQLFVTVSSKLCRAIKKHVHNLTSYLSGSCKAAGGSKLNLGEINEINYQFKDVPDSFIDLPSNSYPLVISFHKFLMMLDGTLGNSYFDRFRDTKELSCNSIAMQTFIKTREVTYDRFSSLYWPHFNSMQTKLVDCSRAFTEIISHIKGHPMIAEVGTCKLSREDYVALSDNRASTLNKRNRETIYDIYQTYERMKLENGDFDLADLVMDLHHRLRDQQYQKYGGDQIDFVYIDEVQDLTMSQISLFKYVCNNVEDGFIFSGDTAQTIARGIDFRFQDIKNLFYRQFVLSNETKNKDRKGQVSEIFQLSQNFRTHAGILNLSHSIIELLYHFFPNFIDILRPETSRIPGESPVLLKSEDGDNAIIKIFGNNSGCIQNIVEFGAEQVILVRDEYARKEILRFVGEQALVLTILECKGLEFQDVLLYNFFGSSPLRNQWRVIYNFMEEQGLLENFTAKYPSFKESKHNIMCSELKQLYVAVTRTRQRLWFCENGNEQLEPIFDYWKKKGLVQVCQLDDSLVQTMTVASTPEDWKVQGKKLYNEHNYEMATRCFEKARDTYWERRSRASGLKARADSIRHANHEEADAILREAAEIFDAIGKADSAAQCYFELRDFEKAGTIFLEQYGESSELYKAGECFDLAGRFERAAEIYAKGNFFFECLRVCSKGKLFDFGLQYINHWKDLKNEKDERLENMEQEFLESCALHYHNNGDHKSMMKFINAFHSTDLMRSFLKLIDCLDELLRLEEESGNFLEAACIAKKKGDIIRQAYLLGKAEKFEDASVLILRFVLSNSLWTSGSKGWPLKEFSGKAELLKKAKSFAKCVSSDFYEYVCIEADILSNKEMNFIEMKDWFFFFRRFKSVEGEMLAVRKILELHLGCKASKFAWEDKFICDPILHKEKISTETMVFFWEFWMNNTLKIFDCLGSLTINGIDEYGEFGLSFLGVSREVYNQNDVYFLLNSDANWVREVDRKSIRKNSKLVSIDVCSLISSARNYWRSEMLDLGLKILKTLENLNHFSIKDTLSLFLQSRSLIHIFEVAKFLLENRHLDRGHNESRTLQNYVKLTINDFVNRVFPLKSNMSLDDNMISLRCTALAGELLQRKIAENSSLRLSHGLIGRTAMMILGSSKLRIQPFDHIAKWSDEFRPWNLFFKHLIGAENQADISLVLSFYQALNETYRANWVKERDYISPFCFLYLLERILIMASSFNGSFITSKSSFVEWFIYYRGEYKPSCSRQIDLGRSLEPIIKFLVDVSRDCLVNKNQMTDWLYKSEIMVKDYYPNLVLRFFMIICLLHLNFGVGLDLLYELLSMNYISNPLLLEFRNTLRRRRRDNVLNVFAEFFRKIGNPMVIVNVGIDRPLLTSQDAISIDMRGVRRLEDVLQVLFPKIVDDREKETISRAKTYGSEKVLDGSENKRLDVVSNVDAIKVDMVENSDLVNPAKGEEFEEISSFGDQRVEAEEAGPSEFTKKGETPVEGESLGSGETPVEAESLGSGKTPAVGSGNDKSDEEEGSKAKPMDGSADSTRQDNSKKKKGNKNKKSGAGKKKKKK